MSVRKVDVLVGKLGDPGKFQLIAFFCLVTNNILVLSNFLAMTFFAAKTKYHCKLSDGQTVAQHVPILGSSRDNEPEWDGCHVYVGNSTNVTEPCSNGWTYYLENNEATIISDFDLVCNDAYKSDLSSTIFFAGVMLSALTMGYFADTWGRKMVTGIMHFITIGLSLALSFTRSFVAFSIVRFFLGFTLQAILNTAFVLGIEIFQTKYRTLASIICGIPSAIGGFVLVMLAYLIQDWKCIQLGLTVLPVLQLAMLCFVPESLRWLLLKKRYKDAEAVIHRMVSFNNLPFPREAFDDVKQLDSSYQNEPSHQAAHTASFTEIFKVPTLRNRTVILSVTWFTVISTFYGLSFHISFLFGDKYFNFGISLIVDVVGLLLMMWVCPRFGRRRPLACAFFLCGVANIVALITEVVQSDAKGVKVLGTITSLFGKSCALSCLIALYGLTSELYPTLIRNIALGINTFWGRLGGMAAPQILLLGLYTSSAVPYSIIGGLTLLSAFLIIQLPETHNLPLFDTIEQAKQFHAKTVVELEPEERKNIGKDGGKDGITDEGRDEVERTADIEELSPFLIQLKTSL